MIGGRIETNDIAIIRFHANSELMSMVILDPRATGYIATLLLDTRTFMKSFQRDAPAVLKGWSSFLSSYVFQSILKILNHFN